MKAGLETMESASESRYIPAELQTKILLNLPIETLLRFTCVCKSWYSTIYHPTFMAEHTNLNKNNSNNAGNFIVVAVKGGHIIKKHPVRRLGNMTPEIIAQAPGNQSIDVYYQVKGSVNGLMLVYRVENHCLDLRRELTATYENMLLWNPSIRKSLVIPLCPLDQVVYALGCSSSSNDYKVVAFQSAVEHNLRFKLQTAVYELSVGLWKTKTIGLNPNIYWLLQAKIKRIVFANGAFHWFFPVNEREVHRLEVIRCFRTLSFELDTEEFSYEELPHPQHWKQVIRFCFLLGESLALFDISPVHSCIWVLEKYGGRMIWTKWYSGDSDLDSYKFFRVYTISNMVYVQKSSSLLMASNTKVWSYHIRSHQIKCIIDDSMISITDIISYMEPYVESWVLSEAFFRQKVMKSLP